MANQRYSNKRHQGPTHRGFKPFMKDMEGNIPVIVAVERHSAWIPEGQSLDGPFGRQLVIIEHCRAFYCHPTKGWRSTGPEGRR